MINLKTLKEDNTIHNLEKRGYHLPNEYPHILNRRKELNETIEAINKKVNQHINTIEDKEVLRNAKKDLCLTDIEFNNIVHMIPNILHHTVPYGKGEGDNVILKTFFDDKKNHNNLHHGVIGKSLGLDIETGVLLAHARFNVMRGTLAKLQRKLINMALDFYGTMGYEECYVPNLVNEETMFGTGQYPKFKEELFITEGNNKLYLVPTGEVPLTNLVRNKVFTTEAAEMKLMTHTPCFRKEVGAYGKDTKGIIRQHQFEKLELVRTCIAENGLQNFEQMIEEVTQFIMQFNIPFRIIELCAGDIGFAGHKAYDFEIWFPNENKYREIATVTWCHDFQARRMNAKYKNKNKEKFLLHTLNGTGLAVGRVLAAIMENYNEEEIKALLDN